MPNLSRNRTLRKAVVRLHALPSEDFDAVVASLDGGERIRVLELLSEFDGEKSQVVDENETFEEVVVPPDLSHWLVARVNGHSDFGEETADQFVMTHHARTILRQCAAIMMPQPGRVKRSPSLFDRVKRAFE
jgi:hypothetical protein